MKLKMLFLMALLMVSTVCAQSWISTGYSDSNDVYTITEFNGDLYATTGTSNIYSNHEVSPLSALLQIRKK